VIIISFEVMSDTFLSDTQIELLRKVITKDKTEQLQKAKDGYKRFRRDKLKNLLNDPASIQDERVGEENREAILNIV
jgi:hypothetical protein